MGDYVNKPSKDAQTIVLRDGVNVKLLAEQLAKLLSLQGLQGTSGSFIQDGFNDENSLSKLADSMVVQRGDKKANFDQLGDVKTTKVNEEETQNKIDLLSDLE